MGNEKRLIDANALKNHINALSPHWLAEWSTIGVLAEVDKAPTVDAVEVVRCKDCKHLEISGCYGECGRAYLGIVKPWDYCSRGERRKGE